MKKYLLVALIALTGCEYRIDHHEWEAIAVYCSDKEGVDFVTLRELGNTFVACNNGARVFVEFNNPAPTK